MVSDTDESGIKVNLIPEPSTNESVNNVNEKFIRRKFLLQQLH